MKSLENNGGKNDLGAERMKKELKQMKNKMKDINKVGINKMKDLNNEGLKQMKNKGNNVRDSLKLRQSLNIRQSMRSSLFPVKKETVESAGGTSHDPDPFLSSPSACMEEENNIGNNTPSLPHFNETLDDIGTLANAKEEQEEKMTKYERAIEEYSLILVKLEKDMREIFGKEDGGVLPTVSIHSMATTHNLTIIHGLHQKKSGPVEESDEESDEESEGEGESDEGQNYKEKLQKPGRSSMIMEKK